MSAMRRRSDLPWRRVRTGERKRLPSVGQEPSLNSHALTHQHISLAPIGNFLPQLSLPHPWLHKQMSPIQWRIPTNGCSGMQAQMRSDPRWWPEKVHVPYQGGTNHQHLTRLVAASFGLPRVEIIWQGDAYWSDPPCLQCFNHSWYVPPVERLFSVMDSRKQRRDKTLVYAWALKDWAEKAWINPSSRGMAQCIMEMQGKMYDLMDFMLKDLQVLPVLDMAPGSKSRPTPEMPQSKEEG